jgi:hypothetical protein
MYNDYYNTPNTNPNNKQDNNGKEKQKTFTTGVENGSEENKNDNGFFNPLKSNE